MSRLSTAGVTDPATVVPVRSRPGGPGNAGRAACRTWFLSQTGCQRFEQHVLGILAGFSFDASICVVMSPYRRLEVDTSMPTRRDSKPCKGRREHAFLELQSKVSCPSSSHVLKFIETARHDRCHHRGVSILFAKSGARPTFLPERARCEQICDIVHNVTILW